MTTTLNQDQIQQTIAFHGHSCPGLAIGMRAAEYALREFAGDGAQLVAIVETDMCGVDAIQFLTGCTFGKGNLIHRDYGKMAFSFFDRTSGKGARLLLRPETRGDLNDELGGLMQHIHDGSASEEQRQRATEIRGLMQQRFMDLPLDRIFAVSELRSTPPRPARILESLTCEACGEATMESRTRRFAGKILCIPCFQNREQKI